MSDVDKLVNALRYLEETFPQHPEIKQAIDLIQAQRDEVRTLRIGNTRLRDEVFTKNRRERDRHARLLESEAEVMTNSLHCGDNSVLIQQTHNEAAAFRRAAKFLREGQS